MKESKQKKCKNNKGSKKHSETSVSRKQAQT
jgi:hypothetical protein